MRYVNLTAHDINLNDGRVFPPSGVVARVASRHTEIVDDVCIVEYGMVEGLPPQEEGTRFIVSGMILPLVTCRDDLVAPSTSHPLAVKNDKGHIVSVPGFVARRLP